MDKTRCLGLREGDIGRQIIHNDCDTELDLSRWAVNATSDDGASVIIVNLAHNETGECLVANVDGTVSLANCFLSEAGLSQNTTQNMKWKNLRIFSTNMPEVRVEGSDH